MNKKGFAISVVLYTMVILIIGIFYLLLGIVRNRYSVGNDLKDNIISNITPGGPPIGNVLGDIVERKYDLTTPDVDETQYLYGNIDNNYVWYSGKLWRIICLNNDKTVKLVTQGNMTSLAWNISNTDTNYSTSQVRAWLNNEFLPTLSNTDALLVKTTWDYTSYNDFPTSKLDSIDYITNEKVGLPTIYDYYKSSNGGITTYMNNGYYWWTMSTKNDTSEAWYVNSDGNEYYESPDFAFGIRPSVSVIYGVEVSGGDGTKTNPYTILGDKNTGLSSELLSNRISGEYVRFNNTLYRIVGTETINGKKLTKITMADYSVNNNSLVSSFKYGKDNSQRIFNTTYGIGLYLEEWYQADNTIETYATNYIYDSYKSMIANSTDDKIIWYVGATSGSLNDYTLSKINSISATIGLGYYGEMFASQYGVKSTYSNSFWLMTSRSGWQTYNITEYSGSIPKTSVGLSSGIRPYFYLKHDVKITSGSGMHHNPYNLSQN